MAAVEGGSSGCAAVTGAIAPASTARVLAMVQKTKKMMTMTMTMTTMVVMLLMLRTHVSLEAAVSGCSPCSSRHPLHLHK